MKIGSLFSGYGGLDMAVSSVLGGQVAWHVEYDKAPSRILDHHYPTVPNHGDVTQVDFTTIEPVDVLTGGYPCQPFSHAGLRKGTDDDRHLWPHVLRAIREMGPRLVVLENVRGHLTLGFDVVLSDLADLGWSARWGVVRASDAGACHQRARLFIVAYPDSSSREDSVSGVGLPDSAGRGQDAAYPKGDGWDQGWPQSAGLFGGPNVAQRRNGLPTDSDSAREQGSGRTWQHWRGVSGTHGLHLTTSDADLAGSQARGTQPRRAPGQQTPGQRQPMGSDAATRGGGATADASGQRHGRGQDAGMVGRLGTPSEVIGREASTTREVSGDRGHEDAADAARAGRVRAAQQENHDSHSRRGRRHDVADLGSSSSAVNWGDYGPAIARWEHIIGRPAPAPTESGRTGNPRLAPRFVEWMMGLPDGHVTDPAIGISRNDQLKALGNGVVPQQAALALDVLLKGTPYDIRQGLATV